MNLKALLSRLVRREAAADPAVLEARDPAIITLISIIFSTAPKTFTGSATLVTLDSPIATSRPTSLASGSGLNLAHTSVSSSSSVKSTSSSSKSSSSSTSSTTTPSPTQPPAIVPTVAPAHSNSPSPTAVASNGGMSTGGKVGLAFGLILIFLLVIAGAIALYRKRRSDHDNGHQRLDDEKNFLAGGRNPNALPAHDTPAFGAMSGAAATTAAAAPPMARPVSFEARGAETLSVRQSVDSVPQLSLRAVSSFNPGLPNDAQPGAVPAMPANAHSNIVAAGAAGAAAGVMAGAAIARDVSPPTSAHANDPNNPFGHHAEKLSSSPPQDIPLPVSPTVSDIGVTTPPRIEAADFPLPESSPATPGPQRRENGAAATAGAAAIMAATAAAASNKPQGAAPPGTPGPDNVHRVQLDFKPSMDDELEAQAGQLVRLLHEYDDGWALCMRMDRSRQGVVPRTCLSKHPIKPRSASPARPRGPPIRGPGGQVLGQTPRPHSPSSGRNSPSGYGPGAPRQMGQSGRNSPAPGRMSPLPYAQAPRPLTPTSQRPRANSNAAPFPPYQQNRSMSPGPYGGSRLRPQESAESKRRSNSMSNLSSPPIAAPPSKIPTPKVTRKPVPSQGSTTSS